MSAAVPGRFTLAEVPAASRREAFVRDVASGLAASPKFLPCRYLYDPEGSALFEEICALPEYYLTRAEAEILAERAGEIVRRLPVPTELAELGSGSATKTRRLIEAFLARQAELCYLPLDISPTVLEASSRALLHDYPALTVRAVAAEYTEGLRYLADGSRLARLVLWLGSNIGNLDRAEAAAFLREVRATLAPDDRLLVGIDLRKEPTVLEAAYDDSRGVTARFNLNLLARVNRELGGAFDLGKFRHRAVYNEREGRIEMYLVLCHTSNLG